MRLSPHGTNISNTCDMIPSITLPLSKHLLNYSMIYCGNYSTQTYLLFQLQFHLIISPSYIQFYTFTIQLNTNTVLKFVTSEGYMTTHDYILKQRE